MVLEFDRPTGAKTDEKELLYLSALTQLHNEALRKDASIIVDDVKSYLLSRHSLDVSSETIQNLIFNGKDKLDLIELVAFLFVPSFCKLAASEEETDGLQALCPNVVSDVLKMILHDATGDADPKELSTDLLKDIFSKYGEQAVANDEDLLRVLLKVARGEERGPVLLDETSFLRALTCDLGAYNPRNEVSVTTRFQDVWGVVHCYDFNKNIEDAMEEEELFCSSVDGDTTPATLSENNSISIKSISTAPGIDFTAGRFSCKYQVICVWGYFTFSFMGWVYPALSTLQNKLSGECSQDYVPFSSWTANRVPFGCSLSKSILDWLVVFGVIIASGFLVVYVGCIGYEIEVPRGNKKMAFIARVLANLFLAALVLVPILLFGLTADNDPLLVFLRFIASLLGIIVFVLRAVREFVLLDLPCFYIINRQVNNGTTVLHEAQLKKASAIRIQKMMQNAIDVHSSVDKNTVIKAYFGQALANYEQLQDPTEYVGDLRYFWSRWWRSEIFANEGIWFSGRILAANFSQAILAVFILIAGITIARYIHNNWIPPSQLNTQLKQVTEFLFKIALDKSIVVNTVDRIINHSMSFLIMALSILDDAGLLRFDCQALGSYLIDQCQQRTNGTVTDIACNIFQHPDSLCSVLSGLYQPIVTNTASRLGTKLDDIDYAIFREPILRSVSNASMDNITSQLNKFYPQKRYMLMIPCVILSVVAFAASCALAVVVLPSISSTTMKLRSGVIPTFTDPRYTSMRYEVQSVSYIAGLLFWGNFAASFLVGALSGGFIFICLWQVTIPLVQKLFSLILGIGLVVFVRYLFQRTCRIRFYRGFYRTRPLHANLIGLLNECLNFAVSTATVLVRLLKLIFLASLYVGRFDQPFLADGVGDALNGAVTLDAYHRFFMADILSVEAHRHPLIETLGEMYLMKLKHRGEFLTVEGKYYREIFVIALMPWLQKYREKNGT